MDRRNEERAMATTQGQPDDGATLLLSIIIPAYNEASRLPKSLRELRAFLDRQPYAAEVIVVDDGSSDAPPISCVKQPSAGRRCDCCKRRSPARATPCARDCWRRVASIAFSATLISRCQSARFPSFCRRN